jgi:hypothetical protein
MKKGIITCFVLLLVHITYAQHTLLRSEMLDYGSTVTHKYITNFTVIDTTIQGDGAVWDFSSLTHNESVQDLVVTMAHPDSTPYAADFPNATYAYVESSTTINYRFFNLTSDRMERVGSYVSSVNTYTDPQIEYVFPLTLGTKNSDTWNNTNSSFGGGTYSFECVGSGTLITPTGTFDALMVRVRMVELFDVDAYHWYSADNGAQLLSYVVGDGLFMTNSGMYADEITVGSGTITTNIDEIDFIKDISYNNPVENTLKLQFNSHVSAPCSYIIVNSVGKVVYQETSSVIDGYQETVTINFSNYPSGIYFLKLSIDGAETSVKTVKVIKK